MSTQIPYVPYALIDPMECEKMDRSAIWSKYEAARAKDAEEIAKWKGIVKGVHGALADLGDIPVPALDADLYDTVMSIRAKDAELIQMAVDMAHERVSGVREKMRELVYKKETTLLAAADAAGFKPSGQ